MKSNNTPVVNKIKCIRALPFLYEVQVRRCFDELAGSQKPVFKRLLGLQREVNRMGLRSEGVRRKNSNLIVEGGELKQSRTHQLSQDFRVHETAKELGEHVQPHDGLHGLADIWDDLH